MNAGDTTIELPRGRKLPWLILIAAGVGLLLLGGPAVAGDMMRNEQAPPLSFLLAGGGLFLVGFGAIFLLNKDRAASLVVGSEHLDITCADGSSTTLTLASLRRASTRAGQNDKHIAVLHKRDGGLIELGRFADEQAAGDAVAPIQSAIDALDAAAADGVDDPLALLSDLPHIDAKRDGDALEVRWSGSGSLAMRGAMFGPLVGMLIIVTGFHRNGPSLGTALGLGFCGLLALLMLWSIIRQLGVTQRIRIDGRHITVDRLRGSKLLSSSAAPIFSVVAIDYTHQLDVIGGQLLLRLRAAQDALEEMGDEAQHAGDDGDDGDDLAAAGAVATQALAMLSNSEHVPTGRLSLSERIALDSALSAELARRSGRAARQV